MGEMDKHDLPLINPPPPLETEQVAPIPTQPPHVTSEPPQPGVFTRYLQIAAAIWMVSVMVIAVAVSRFGFPDDVVDPGDGSGDFIAVMGIVGVMLLTPGAIGYGIWSRFRPTSALTRGVGQLAQFLYLGLLAILMIVTYENSMAEGIAATTWFVGAIALGFAAGKTIKPRPAAPPTPPAVIRIQDS